MTVDVAKTTAFINAVLQAVGAAVEVKDTSTLQKTLETAVTDFTKSLDTPVVPVPVDAENLFNIVKASDEERMIWGWGSVITLKGQPVVDSQNDVIELHELKQAVYKFMDEDRVGGESHKVMGVGTVVESLVFSEELQKALGIDLGKEGWFIGVRVDKDATWAKVKSGELRSFSLGGTAERVPLASR
jgi:hypothetical protein